MDIHGQFRKCEDKSDLDIVINILSDVFVFAYSKNKYFINGHAGSTKSIVYQCYTGGILVEDSDATSRTLIDVPAEIIAAELIDVTPTTSGLVASINTTGPILPMNVYSQRSLDSWNEVNNRLKEFSFRAESDSSALVEVYKISEEV